jgi:proprotein convertase subtilisin/kexin type 5
VSGTSYLISQSVSNVWRHSCFNTVCKRCNPANTSICIDCYDKTISDFYIFDTSQSTCTRDCTTGFFLTTGNICSPCFTNCLECANVSTNCTSCNAAQSLYLDINYKKCVTTCEDGYYKNTQVQQCLQCSSPCLYCVDSATKCTFCPLGKFLLNRDCLSNCPTTKIYI